MDGLCRNPDDPTLVRAKFSNYCENNIFVLGSNAGQNDLSGVPVFVVITGPSLACIPFVGIEGERFERIVGASFRGNQERDYHERLIGERRGDAD